MSHGRSHSGTACIAAGFFIIVLVIALRRIERPGGLDRRDYGLLQNSRLFEFLLGGCRGTHLRWRVGENCSLVTSTSIAELPAGICWIDAMPEYVEQFFVCYLFGIEENLDGFAVSRAASRDLLVG